jgi:glutaredoxin
MVNAPTRPDPIEASARSPGGEPPVKLFWQPGCSSCLRTKEFLTRAGVPFVSVNIHGDEAAMAELRGLGARSVPVVSRGRDFVFGQVLEDVGKFLGIEAASERLAPAELLAKLDRVLAVAESAMRQIPESRLGETMPGRDRSHRQLGFHIFNIPEIFLDVANGAFFAAGRFDDPAPAALRTGAEIAGYGAAIRRRLAAWWAEQADPGCAREVETYFGRKSLHVVLERTTWHSAQHTRQLLMVLDRLGIDPAERLSPADLAGLPLPENVWDIGAG